MNDKFSTTALPADEQKLLDTALLESDQLLVRSLHDDQHRRRRRTMWLFILAIGGVAMTTLVWGILSGLLAVTVPSAADIEQSRQLSQEGWQLWQQRDMKAAEEKFAKSVELNPKDADAWNGLGWSQFNGGKSIEGEEAFQQCVKLKPKHPAGLNGLGQIYLMWKEYDTAEKYLKKAAPQAPAAWYGLTRLYLLQGEFKKAKPWAKRLVAQDPANADAKQMLEAANSGELDESLRLMIEPAGKPAGTAEKPVAEERKAQASNEDDEFSDWRNQLTAAGEDSRWFVGANFGQTLSDLPENEALEILKPCWSEIADSVRPHILKGFTPGMKKTPGINDRFFEVMDLGLKDSKKTVREFATTYINAITLSHLADDPKEYEAWKQTWQGRAAEDVALEQCKQQIEAMKELQGEEAVEAMQRLSDAANDLREFKAMQKVALESGLYDVVDRWIDAKYVSENSNEYQHLISNVPR